MHKKLILIALILIISLGWITGCRNIIKTGCYPHRWIFKIEGIEPAHLSDSNSIFRFYIHNYCIHDVEDCGGHGISLWGSSSSFEASQYFDRGEIYEIELVIENQNYEEGRYEFVNSEERIKEIEQKYHFNIDSTRYSEYEYKTVIWEVKFLPLNSKQQN